MKSVLIDHRGRTVEVWLQYCRAEFGLGLWVSLSDGHHLTLFGLVGPFNFSFDLWLPLPLREA